MGGDMRVRDAYGLHEARDSPKGDVARPARQRRVPSPLLCCHPEGATRGPRRAPRLRPLGCTLAPEGPAFDAPPAAPR